MSSSHSRSTTEAGSSNTPNTTFTRKTSAYDAVFEQHLINHGIYPDGYDGAHTDDDDDDDDHGPPRPDNWEDINHRLMQPRSSLSPSCFSKSDFRRFQRTNREALSEAKVMSSVLPVIAGNANIPSQENILYNNLTPLTDGTITTPKPDFYDGARPGQVDQKVREELGPFIVPSKGPAPILPNLFAEAKGPGGRADVAKRQACYDGAVGARAMQYVRSYGGEMQYDGNAYTVTSTYNSGTGTLMMYTTHPTELAESGVNPGYHMTQLASYAMTHNPDRFREGAAAFRNARDWAKEQRDAAIALANEKARANYEDTHAEQPALNPNVSLAADLSSDSDTSEDEGPAPAELYTTSFAVNTAAQDSDDSSQYEPALEYHPPAKRQPSMSPQQAQNKRQQLSPPTSSHSSLQSGATTSLAAEGEERWEWSNGSFRCRIGQGQTFIKQQSNAPMDVWVYYDAGWPEQLDKKWRRCESVTAVTYYS